MNNNNNNTDTTGLHRVTNVLLGIIALCMVWNLLGPSMEGAKVLKNLEEIASEVDSIEGDTGQIRNETGQIRGYTRSIEWDIGR